MGLRVRMLGGLVVEGVAPHRLGDHQARRLLSRLCLARGGPVGVTMLVEALWPLGWPSRAAERVAALVHTLRSTLGRDCLRRVGSGYKLRTRWLDVDALAELAIDARRRLDADQVGAARAATTAALALARGPLLPEEYPAGWVLNERTVCELHVASARQVAAEAALRGGDPWQAAETAHGALAAEPYDEVSVRLLMRALAASGRPALAVEAYNAAATRFREDLGVGPAVPTEELYRSIISDGVVRIR